MMTYTIAGIGAVLLIASVWMVGMLAVFVAAHSYGKEWEK